MLVGRGDATRWKQIENEPKSLAWVFEIGDEIGSILEQFARKQVRRDEVKQAWRKWS
jgi:hypothetical protein